MGVENLEKVLWRATDSDISEGCASYPRYNRIMSMIGEKWGYDARTTAAVFCALSPNNDYNGNLRDTNNLLEAKRGGWGIEGFKVSTYGNNKRKAWALAGGADPLELIKAPKTRNFFLNVSDPKDPVPVTIDGHIFNVWNGRREKLTGLRTLGDYDEVADGVRQVAREYGYIPCEMQGILWVTWKRIHRILITPQMSFWHDDMACAGVGFHLKDFQHVAGINQT